MEEIGGEVGSGPRMVFNLAQAKRHRVSFSTHGHQVDADRRVTAPDGVLS